jgi:hypothetical protein
MPQRVLELLTRWGASFGYSPAKEVWQLVFVVFNVVYLEGEECTAF